jgi:GGDEF domain-containing protein
MPEPADEKPSRVRDAPLLASRLRAALRAGDTAARVGGDEFVVLFDDVATKEAAMVVAERLNVALRAPYAIGPGFSRSTWPG